MKKLFLTLMTANFSGTLLSLVVFLINTYRLPLHEYFLYGYLNSALIIAGLLILFGTDNLALASYERFGSNRVNASVKRIKSRMLLVGLLVFFAAFAYFRFTHPDYAFSLVAISFALSLPFLVSFYYTDTHSYIHRKVYHKFVRTALLIRLAGLVPVAVAAYFQRYLLPTTLTVNALALLLPALQFRSAKQAEAKGESFSGPLFPPLRLFENFVTNSYPVLYINAAFFLFGSLGDDFTKYKVLVYTSRIFIVFGGIAASIISVMVSSHLRQMASAAGRLGNHLYGFVLVFLALTLALYSVDLSEPARFIAWNALELTALAVFFAVFFTGAFTPHEAVMIPAFVLATLVFFLAVKLQAPPLNLLMFERTVFVLFLTALAIFFCKKASIVYEKTAAG